MLASVYREQSQPQRTLFRCLYRVPDMRARGVLKSIAIITQMVTEAFLQPAGQLTVADVVRFGYFHYIRRFWPLTAFCLALSLLGFLSVLSSGDSERLQNPGLFYVFLFVFTFLQFGIPYLGARRQYAALRYLREPMRFHFTTERIRLEGPSFSGEASWPLVHSVYETKNAFLIYQSSQAAWILPKRFFWGEDQEIQRWRQFVIQHLTKPGLFRKPELLGAWS